MYEEERRIGGGVSTRPTIQTRIGTALVQIGACVAVSLVSVCAFTREDPGPVRRASTAPSMCDFAHRPSCPRFARFTPCALDPFAQLLRAVRFFGRRQHHGLEPRVTAVGTVSACIDGHITVEAAETKRADTSVAIQVDAAATWFADGNERQSRAVASVFAVQRESSVVHVNGGRGLSCSKTDVCVGVHTPIVVTRPKQPTLTAALMLGRAESNWDIGALVLSKLRSIQVDRTGARQRDALVVGSACVNEWHFTLAPLRRICHGAAVLC